MEERALPHSGRADDGNHLASLDIERQIAQNVKPLCADEVGFVEVGCGEERHRGYRGLRKQRGGRGTYPRPHATFATYGTLV